MPLGGSETEGRAQRLRLVPGDLLEMVPQRPADLEQRRELELRLRLDAKRAHDRHPLGAVDRVVEERRLADAGLATDHQRSGSALAGPIEELVEPRALALAAEQHGSTVTASRTEDNGPCGRSTS